MCAAARVRAYFTLQRRRMSVIVEDNQGQHILICKGAVEEIMRLSTHVEINGEILKVLPEDDQRFLFNP
jgi:Mg2+-importing ATPase